ncbi:MAG TPA: STAS domain-containing protein [Acidimicrobiales bacterium]|nr:STAS domain-containing protein [Acidimicrobiales bacterium]
MLAETISPDAMMAAGEDDLLSTRWCLGPQWRMDPKLELWVDVECSPVVIRLTGTLDGSTAASVLAVTADLVEEGYREVVMDTTELRVGDAEGARTLVRIEELVDRWGGHLSWTASTN